MILPRHINRDLYTNESYAYEGIKLVRITDLLNPCLSYSTMLILNWTKND